MAEKASHRTQIVALSAIPALAAFLAWAGCRRAPAGYKLYTSPGGDFSCEIPAAWEYLSVKKDKEMYAVSPVSVGEVTAHLAIYPNGPKWSWRDLSKEMLNLRIDYARDANFRLDPLQEVRVGEFTGWRYSLTYTDPGGAMVSHRMTPPPPPVPTKETLVYIVTPGGTPLIEYLAPLAIYDKYQPAFERLLKTFRWTGAASKGGGGSSRP